MEDERRSSPRIRALKGAHILLPGHYSTFDCTIRNLAAAGAKLRLPSTVGVPDRFDLKFDSGETHRCQVRWRSQTELGVVFEDLAA